MNLNSIAESDLEFVLEDLSDGFGVEVIVTTPAGLTKVLTGQSTDIGNLIDPQTGVFVIGRNCEVVFRISSLLSEFGSIPNKTATGEGWLFQIANTNNEIWNFAIDQSMVDRKLGIVKYVLGLTDVDNAS